MTDDRLADAERACNEAIEARVAATKALYNASAANARLVREAEDAKRERDAAVAELAAISGSDVAVLRRDAAANRLTLERSRDELQAAWRDRDRYRQECVELRARLNKAEMAMRGVMHLFDDWDEA